MRNAREGDHVATSDAVGRLATCGRAPARRRTPATDGDGGAVAGPDSMRGVPPAFDEPLDDRHPHPEPLGRHVVAVEARARVAAPRSATVAERAAAPDRERARRPPAPPACCRLLTIACTVAEYTRLGDAAREAVCDLDVAHVDRRTATRTPLRQP